MLIEIFLAIVGAALLILGLFWLLEKRKVWNDEILEGVTGVKDWRKRLNGCTDRFVALGAEPLLARAASKSADPVLSALTGQTLAQYQRIKDMYVALSYAYNCGSRAVQQAESMFRIPGPLKLVTIRNAGELAEQGLEIKEISQDRYVHLLPLDRRAPKPPVYKLDYLFKVCDKLSDEISKSLQAIAASRPQAASRLAAADKALAAATQQYDNLNAAGVTYLPKETRLSAIAALKASISAGLEANPMGTIERCKELDQAIAAFAGELDQARKLLAAVKSGEDQLAQTVTYIAKVRSTQVTCPWSNNDVEPVYWQLNASSNPDADLTLSAASYAQARQNLAKGNLQTVNADCSKGQNARTQAEATVKALFDAKTTIDAQVPLIRAELVAIQSEKVSVTGGANTQDMGQLVDRTCAAVESRIVDAHALYVKQQFGEALAMITGTAGNEYGMPVSKLLAQAKELLALLKKAAQVANSLAQQPS